MDKRPLGRSGGRGSAVEKYLTERGFRILEALDAIAASAFQVASDQ